MEACRIAELGLESISGMGEIPRSSDLTRYAGLSGRELVFDRPGPQWVIQLRGEIPQPIEGEDWFDPLCVVAEGEPLFVATGKVRLPDGTIVSPRPVPAPSFRLPPLAP